MCTRLCWATKLTCGILGFPRTSMELRSLTFLFQIGPVCQTFLTHRPLCAVFNLHILWVTLLWCCYTHLFDSNIVLAGHCTHGRVFAVQQFPARHQQRAAREERAVRQKHGGALKLCPVQVQGRCHRYGNIWTVVLMCTCFGLVGLQKHSAWNGCSTYENEVNLKTSQTKTVTVRRWKQHSVS